MGFELERKILVSDGWQDLMTQQMHIRQAYLTANGKASIYNGSLARGLLAAGRLYPRPRHVVD